VNQRKKVEIILYSKDECCLCDEAEAIILETVQKMDIQEKVSFLKEDITKSPELYERYKTEIPYILLNGNFAFRYKVHPVTRQRKLSKLLLCE